jgi:predicted short-subunit dehydrogenase-like oxidoreductase (DUF2520 family)
MDKKRLEAVAWKLEHLCAVLEECAECETTGLDGEIDGIEHEVGLIEAALDRIEQDGGGDVAKAEWRV